MRRNVFRSLAALAVAALGTGACGAGEAETDSSDGGEAASEVMEPMTVRFVTPTDGETLDSPVRVVFEVTGLEIVPAGEDLPRSGHHHLLVDQDIPPAGTPIPSTAGYSHYGQAQTEADIDLPPGEHRLIAVVADFAHIPLQPLVVDTVTVVVR